MIRWLRRHWPLAAAGRRRAFNMSENARQVRWGRRIGLGLLVVALLLIAVHALWSGVVAKGVQRRVAALRAAGEPILPEDFSTPVLAPAENGGPDILAAGDAIG